MKNKSVILWLTGLSGAGKTTIARGIESKLKARNCLVEVLDGDEMRTQISKELGFTKEDRETNMRRLGFVANLLSRNGIIAIVAAISPYRFVRDEIRVLNENFIEIYVDTPLEICEARDVKGLYAKARSGQIKNFTGLEDPYEAPLNPEIICRTTKESVEECVDKVIAELERLNYIPISQNAPIDNNAKPQFFRLKTQLLSKGRSDYILACTDLMSIRIKCYAQGGENVLHAHPGEDHAFVILAGVAKFSSKEGEVTTLARNHGILLPKGCYYKFESCGEEPLVMLRVGAELEKLEVNRIGLDGRFLPGKSKENKHEDGIPIQDLYYE
jgi:adenylylsulfate kinase